MSKRTAFAAPTQRRREVRGGASDEELIARALSRRLAARAGVALVLVNVRYWCTVAPLVRRQLRCWRGRAETIDDPVLRTLALAKLEDEGFNAEAAAMLATLVSRKHRRRAVEAMVATEIIYDYLDGLTESPSGCTPADGARLFTALTDAVSPALPSSGDYYRNHPHSERRYLEPLVATVRQAISGLPATAAIADLLRASAARGAAAQLQIHAAELRGGGDLELWARQQAAGTSLQWREFLAGAACSVLSLHALIVAASDPGTTYQQALDLDRIYLSISVLPTVLDSVVDYAADTSSGKAGYVQHYEDSSLLAQRLVSVLDDAIARSRRTPHGAHHVLTLVGVVAYYLSDPGADTEFSRSVTVHLARRAQPLLAPTLAMMRTWRTAKQLRARWRAASVTRIDQAA
jgi:tetraprenyl-beta-curcumene synthase